MPKYTNIWTAPGQLGSRTRAHASVVYDSATAAIEGQDVPPGPGWILLGTLGLDNEEQPRFVGYATLRERASTEEVAAAA